jgi:hypothetical protein
MNLFAKTLLFSVMTGFCFLSTALFAAPTTRPSTRRAKYPSVKIRTSLSLQQRFFHLHQTIGHWESWKNGRCSLGWKRGKQHLRRVLQSRLSRVAHPFLGFEQKLRKVLAHPHSVTTSRLEQWRMQIHTLAERWKLNHRFAWRKEFWRCSHRKK